VCVRERERERERGSENLPGTCKDGGRKVLGTYIKTDELQI